MIVMILVFFQEQRRVIKTSVIVMPCNTESSFMKEIYLVNRAGDKVCLKKNRTDLHLTLIESGILFHVADKAAFLNSQVPPVPLEMDSLY